MWAARAGWLLESSDDGPLALVLVEYDGTDATAALELCAGGEPADGRQPGAFNAARPPGTMVTPQTTAQKLSRRG